MAAVRDEGAPGAAGGNQARLSRRSRRLLVVLVVLVVLVAAIWIVKVQIDRTKYSPSGQVRAYLDAMVEKDVDTVFELFDSRYPAEQSLLLSDEILDPIDSGLTGYEIGTVSVNGDTARIEVTLEQGDETETATYEAEKTGEQFLLLSEWRLTPILMRGGPLHGVELSWPDFVTEVEINGFPVDVSGFPDRTAVLPAFPGTYTVAPVVDDDVFTPTSEEVSIGLPGTVFLAPDVDLDARISEETVTEVQELVNAAIDECARSAQPDPPSCGFSASAERPGSWRIMEYPRIEVEYRGGEIRFHEDRSGLADFTPEGETPAEGNQHGRFPSMILVSGTVSVADDGTVSIDLNPVNTG